MSQISVTYTGDGTSVIFTIPFPYIDQSDVQVLVNGSQVTAFTFVNATTIQFSVAPTNGATIEIRRSTAADISNQFFANSSIRSQSLNENFQQTLFVAEEAREIAADAQAGSLVPGSIGTSALADGAVTDAKVASGAAIAGTKISPDFGSQTVVTTGGFTGNLIGNVTGTASAIADNTVTSAKIVNGSIVDADISSSASIAGTKLATIATAGKVSNSATTATSANTASAIVARDASGNFTAGTITAALTGNASTATALNTARTIGGVSFNGTANINLPGVNTAGNQNTSGNAATATTATNCSRQIINGNGMNFTGGALDANRTITLGTPGTLNSGTTNSVTTSSHTHNITVVGTVSQSGGNPTGAIIQQGTNSNGRWVRYADGTQIAFIAGSESRSSSGKVTTNVTLPATFADANVNPNGALYSEAATLRTSVPETATSISTDNGTTTSIQVLIIRSNSTNTAFRLIIFGRWF
jgi:hypothetical protein